ncbi:MAG: WXG100 family type VII secretion target [Acidimicrobiales bacterium]
MTYIKVDPAVLRLVSQRLTDSIGVAREVDESRGNLKAHVGGEQSTLRDAVNSFLDEWGYGCECLIEDATQTSRRLDHASQCYLEVEGDIRGILRWLLISRPPPRGAT